MLRERLRSSLWFTPSLFIGGALLAALVLAAVDRELAETPSGERLLLMFSGGPEAARAVLETIAGSILTLTALVFSITVLVLQLTSTQYSPRALRTFLRDRTSKVTMGVFLGTFTFALLGLREVRSITPDSEAFVPGTIVTGALLLTFASLYMFLVYIHHVAQRIQASSIIATIGKESVDALERLYPDTAGEGEFGETSEFDLGAVRAEILSPKADIVVSINEKGLVELAQRCDSRLRMCAGVGDFVRERQPVVVVFGESIEEEEVLRQIRFGEQRTMEQDLRFGLRQLVDVAVRALSPSTNDPSTAVQVLDRLSEILGRLGRRAFPDPVRLDDAGEVRLVIVPSSWGSFVRLAVEEIIYYGGSAPQVRRRLQRMYDELIETLPAERASVVRTVAPDIGWPVRTASEDST